MFDPIKFANWMKTSRKLKQISLRRLTELTGIKNNTLSYIEIHSQDVPTSKFVAICHALGADPAVKLKEFCK